MRQHPKACRWNFDVQGDKLFVCKNNHEKSEPCEYEELTASEIAKIIEELVAFILKGDNAPA